MVNVVSISIDKINNKFVVSVKFRHYLNLPRSEFDTYKEAWDELVKIIRRENIRHEIDLDDGFDW